MTNLTVKASNFLTYGIKLLSTYGLLLNTIFALPFYNIFIATQYYPNTVKITTARNNTSIRVLAIFLSFLVNKLFVDVGRFIDRLYLVENLLSLRVIIDNIS